MSERKKSSRDFCRTQTMRYVAWAIPLAAAVIILAASSQAYITNLVTDDALYYPVVAQSIATGNGSSYDGITQTNVYHPLWCWLQIPVAGSSSCSWSR